MSISDVRFQYPNPPTHATSNALLGIANDLPVVIFARACLEMIRPRLTEKLASQRQFVHSASRPSCGLAAPELAFGF